MKKLMTILGATATLFASCVVHGEAEPWETGTSFESYTGEFNPQLSDIGEAGDTYWYTGDTAPTFVLTNYEAEASTETPIAKRPDKFKDADNGRFLMIETSSPDVPLFRSALPYLGGVTGDNVGKFSPVTNTADKTVYLDTLVKFTESDSVFSKNLSDGDKIAIEYVERDEELDPEDESIIKVHGITNFVIRAGFIGGPQTNYVAKLPANFDKNEWHRLTVRTVLNIDGNNSVGFVIYVDEEALEYDTDTIARTGEFAATAGDFTPAGVAANFYKDDYRALYPSVIQSGVDKFTISAAGFSGNGAVDDVTFSAKVDFIEASEQVPVTFTVPTGVTAITVDGVAIDLADPTTNLAPDVEAFELVVTVDSANGYTFAGISGAETNAEGKVIVQKPAMAITVLASRNNFSLFDENGDPILGTFETLGAALAAQGVAKIQLAYDYDVTDADLYGGYINIDQSTTLDLNGKTLDGGESLYNPLFMVNDGNFVIIDSVGGGKVVYDGPGIVYGATAYIGAVNDDLGPTFDGQLFFEGGEGNVIRGKFDETSNTAAGDEPAFLWEAYLGDGDSVESECTGPVAGYWVVAPEGGSDENWVPDSSAIPANTSAATQYPTLAGTALATADAKQLTDWAKANSVAFSDVKASADSYVDAFLLNCAVADVAAEKEAFVVNISFDSVTGEPIVTKPDGKNYNGELKIYGSDDLSIPKANWDEQTDGDTFFYGELVLP